MNFYLHLGNCQSHFEHLTDQSDSPNINRIFGIPVWFTDLNQLQSAILSPDYITEAQLHWKFSSASHYKIYILRKSVPSGIQNRSIGFHSVVLGGCLAAAHHPSNILLKVYVLVVQIRPWHVLWLSPLLRLSPEVAVLEFCPPVGLLSVRVDEVAAQALVCGRALWHSAHLLLWSPNWLTTGAEDKQSQKEPIPLASLEQFR